MDGVTKAEMRAGDTADDTTPGRLHEELEAATAAAFNQIRMIAATVSVEAKLSIVSAMSVATARSLCVVFLAGAWICLMALTVLSLSRAGLSEEVTLLSLVVVNVAIATGMHRWQKWLVGNIGFSRTRRLLRQLSVTRGQDSNDNR